MSLQNITGFSWFGATATSAAPTYPASSGTNNATATATDSVTEFATKVIIHSVSTTLAVAGNTLIFQSHSGAVTYFTVSLATAGTITLDILLPSGFRVVGGTVGTATALITYIPLTAEGPLTTP